MLRRTEAGVMVWTLKGSDKQFRVKTQQCGHCGRHWEYTVHSGRTRGWCQNCAKPYCGPNCVKCVPLERYLESIEKKIDVDKLPVIG